MGTVLSVQILSEDDGRLARRERENGVARVVEWFRRVEQDCSRFDPNSELRRLCATVGRPIIVSALLYRAIEFAIAVATETDGAFDPTVGAVMENHGFDVHHRTGERNPSRLRAGLGSFRDVELDPAARTVTLHKPLLIDLGAVAKGLAIDLGAEELRQFKDFAIDAGGDLYLGGCAADGERWSIGVRNPRAPDTMIETILVSDVAVCTSGDYERRTTDGTGHHLIDPRTATPATAVASVTTIAPSAMVGDALATAAFVLGPEEGLALLEQHDVEGLILTPSLERSQTRGWSSLSRVST